ncbi:hypothetical protein CP532_4495 [Ophiocordyceps camponoti-leonardi (nom. inval.)]|nr:hypothetical protein CP532_4495 [Ophiocordyceps camponoti-leonardi (nom. inval.)]
MKELIILGLAALSHGAVSPDTPETGGSRLLTEKASLPSDWLQRQAESIWNNEEKCLRALSKDLHTSEDRINLCRYFLREEGDENEEVSASSELGAKALRALAECDPVTAARVCSRLERGGRVDPASGKRSCFEMLKMDLGKNPERAWEVCRLTFELGEEGVGDAVTEETMDKDVDIDQPLPRDEAKVNKNKDEKEEENQVPESCYDNREIVAKACLAIGAPESLGMPGCRGVKNYDETIKLLTFSGLNRLCDQIDRGQQLSEAAIGSRTSETLTPKAVRETVEAVKEACRCHRRQQARSHEWLSGLKTSVRPFIAAQTGGVGRGDQGEDFGSGSHQEGDSEFSSMEDFDKEEEEEEESIVRTKHVGGWSLSNTSSSVLGSGNLSPFSDEADEDDEAGVVFAGSGRISIASKLLLGSLGLVLFLN